MAKEENLRPIELTHDEARKFGTLGGIESGRKRRERKTMREQLEMLLQSTKKHWKVIQKRMNLLEIL